MATIGEDARVFVKVNVLVRLARDQIEHIFDFVGSTILAKLLARASLSADRRALTTAYEHLCASQRAWDPVARDCTGQITCRVRALRAACLFCTRAARLMALFVAGRVTAARIAFGIAWRTRLVSMTCSAALVFTCRIAASTILLADAVICTLDVARFVSDIAFVTRVLTRMIA